MRPEEFTDKLLANVGPAYKSRWQKEEEDGACIPSGQQTPPLAGRRGVRHPGG